MAHKILESRHQCNSLADRDQVNPTLPAQRNPGLRTVWLTKPSAQLASWLRNWVSPARLATAAGSIRENLAGHPAP